MLTSPLRVTWPTGLEPPRARIHARNEGWSRAEPAAVWGVLIRARDWSRWYANCRGLQFRNGEGPSLFPGCEFAWTTFGVPVVTVVDTFEPPHRLGWRGQALGSSGYHAWLLVPHEGGTRIITEETQRGLIPLIAARPLRRALHREHQRWVDALGERACAEA